MIEKMKKRRIPSEIMTMIEKTLFVGRTCVDAKLDSGESEVVEFG